MLKDYWKYNRVLKDLNDLPLPFKEEFVNPAQVKAKN